MAITDRYWVVLSWNNPNGITKYKPFLGTPLGWFQMDRIQKMLTVITKGSKSQLDDAIYHHIIKDLGV